MNPLWFPAVLAAASVAAWAAVRLDRFPPLPPRLGRGIVVAATLLYALYFWGRAVRGVEYLEFGYDLAHIENVLWNTTEGRPFRSSFLEGSLLSQHLYLWLWPIAQAWRFVPSPLLVQGLQIAALAATALPLHALGRRAGEGIGVAFALAYLLHAGTHGQTQSAFDPASLGTPFLALALWADAAGRPGPALASLAAALPAKEHYAGVVLVWGLLRARRWPRPAGAAVALGLAWAGLYLCASRAFAVGESQAAIRLAYLDRGPIGAVAGALAEAARPAKIGYLLHLLAPFGFLPLLAPTVSALALPEVGIVLVATFPMHKLLAHYSAATIAPLVAGGAAAAAAVVDRARAEARPAARRAVAAFVLVSAVGHSLLSGLLPPGRIWLAERTAEGAAGRAERAREAAAIRALVAEVPAEAAVGFAGVERPMLPLARRRHLFHPLSYAPRPPARPVEAWFTRAGEAPPDPAAYRLVGEGGGVALWLGTESASRLGASP